MNVEQDPSHPAMKGSSATARLSYAELWGDRWFKIPEAIRISAIGRTRLFALLREGKIRARRYGAINLVEGRSLGEFIDGLPERSPNDAS